MADLSRREFAALAAAAAAAAPFAGVAELSAAAITAHEVIDRIKKHIGVEWKLDSVDGVKAGDPSTSAKGIVTTSMATMAVLQQAVKAGANLVITAHPTFYARSDVPAPPPAADWSIRRCLRIPCLPPRTSSSRGIISSSFA